MLSDEQLEAVTHWKGEGPITIGFHEAVIATARELLAARKAVEAAREYRKVERDLLKGTAGLMNTKVAGVRLDAAITAYDEATK